MKLIDVKLVDTPESSKLYRIRSIPTLVNVILDVLNGGYNVQPIPFQYSVNIDKIKFIYVDGIIKIDILLILGYITSDAPKYIGIK
jgi:predicted membrane chloride channel (bestrophin family)